MGYDISYHPVDVAFIQSRVHDYILNGRPIDDLVQKAVRLAKLRFSANSWGLGLLQWIHAHKQLIGFNQDLHVWGRPFLCDGNSPDAVAGQIDAYLTADEAGARELAKATAQRLAPDVAQEIQPDADGSLPGDKEISEDIRWKLDLLRACWVARQQGRITVTAPNGEDVDARDTLLKSAALEILAFAAHFRPGWMARGYVWPTYLLDKLPPQNLFARILKRDPNIRSLFERPISLVEPMTSKLPDITRNLSDTITENYMVGGFLTSANVPLVGAWMRQNVDRLVQFAGSEGWEGDCRLAVQKIIESLNYAQRHGLAFCEATEVYSAPLGIMN